jgi:Fe-Mn family superoxide dismutase
MKHELPKLKYALDALAPKISKQTMELHWGKHLQAYVNNMNNLIAGTKFENAPLEQIVKESEGALFNNAGQVWNHTFYFDSFSPTPKKAPEGKLLEAITKQFGSLEAFKEQFNKSAVGLFGSGWTWLVKKEDGTLVITQEQNAGNPLHSGTGTTLIGADVWEHAYYVDYQNRRADHLNAFWDVLDWAVVEKRF